MASRTLLHRRRRRLSSSRDGLGKQTLTAITTVKFMTPGGAQLEFIKGTD